MGVVDSGNLALPKQYTPQRHYRQAPSQVAGVMGYLIGALRLTLAQRQAPHGAQSQMPSEKRSRVTPSHITIGALMRRSTIVGILSLIGVPRACGLRDMSGRVCTFKSMMHTERCEQQTAKVPHSSHCSKGRLFS
jgi:hypothetical protein